VGYRHEPDEILEAAVAVAMEVGIGAVTFAKVGERLGISDRTVVYYFPTKPALITAVATALGAKLVQVLDEAFGAQPRSQAELLQRAWPALTTPVADRIFALYFEMIGLASTGQEPYAALAPAMVEGWVEWLTPKMRGSRPDLRRRRALAAVAQIDGLLLVRHVLGADAAAAAAREAGIRSA